MTKAIKTVAGNRRWHTLTIFDRNYVTRWRYFISVVDARGSLHCGDYETLAKAEEAAKLILEMDK